MTADEHLKKLIQEIRKGIFSEEKNAQMIASPNMFLEQYLSNEPDFAEMLGEIKNMIVSGFFRELQKKGPMMEVLERIRDAI